MNEMMIKPIRRSAWFFAATLALLLTLGHSNTASAQILSRGDLFGPGAPPPMIGLELGLGSHQQQGDFNAACGCTFYNGSGNGFLASLVFELPLDYEWALGLKSSLDFKHTNGSQAIVDTAIIQDPANETADTLSPFPLNRLSYVKTTYLEFTPYAQYQFFRMGPFLQAGASIGILIANHFQHQRELTTTDYTFPNTNRTITNIRFQNGTRDETVEDDAITDVNKLRLGVQVAAGYNIAVSERSILSPMITYDIPLTTIRNTAANNWKIGSLYGSAVLKFKLD